MLTVVIPYRDDRGALRRTLAALPERVPVVVVDDASDVPAPEPERANVRVLRLAERGYFAGAVNAGIDATEGDVLVLNQDVQLDGEAWLGLIDEARDAGHATAGDGVFANPAWPMGYVQGTFMWMRRAAIDEIGPFDATNFPLWGATADWQMRACRAGWSALPLAHIPGFAHERGERPYGSSIRRLLDEEPYNHDLYIRTPPLLTVVVPSYNYGAFLRDALNSLLGGPTCLGEMPAQEFCAFEIVIVNDASRDDTARIAEEYADPWKAIRFVNLRRNRGSAGAFNAGIAAGHGRAVTVLSADDMREPWSLAALMEAWEAEPQRLHYDDFMMVTNGERVRHWRMSEYDFCRLREKNHIHAGALYGRHVWEQVGGYPEEFGNGREDWAFAIGAGVQGFGGRRLPRPGYLYRWDGQNRSARTSSHGWQGIFARNLRARYPEAWEDEARLRARYPEAWEDDSMGCCGHRGQKKLKGIPAGGQLMAANGSGGTTIKYVGGNVGKTPFYGAATGKRYMATALDPVLHVDPADAEALLRLRDRKRPVFVAYQEPKAEEPKAEDVDDAQEPKQGDESAPILAEEPAASGSGLPDVSDMTLEELDQWIEDNRAGLTPEHVRRLIAREVKGKDRKGAGSRLAALLQDLEGEGDR